MKSKLIACAFIALSLGGCKTKENQPDVLKFVDPFIGTGAHGHTFPGATRPFSLVQLSPDTHLMGWEASSGYHSNDSLIYAFSHTHLSGTGIGDLGDVALLPYSGNPDSIPVAKFSKNKEFASPGVYSVTLDNFGIDVELTSTERVGMHKYAYAQGAERKVMLNLAHILQANWGHRILNNEVDVVSNEKITGTIVTRGWAHHQTISYVILFSEPFTSARFAENGKTETITAPFKNDSTIQSQLYFSFADSDKPLFVKVAISPVDVEGAEKNMAAELPGWDFDAVKAQSQNIWRDQLANVSITTQDTTVLKNFYTALYHTMVAPILWQDVDGRYKGMDKEIHQAAPGYVNYTAFSLWDTFRTLHPWMSIYNPEKAKQFGDVLVQGYKEGTILPKWPLASNYTGCMVGYPAVAVLADLAAKGIVNQADLNLWKEAGVNSSVYRADLAEKFKGTRELDMITKHIYFKEKYGFVPADSISESVSWGVEMAYYDWCIAKLAELAGDTAVAKAYYKKGDYYKRYLDPETGLMRGVMGDGKFRTPFNPFYSAHMESDYVEGTAFQWSYFFPHAVNGYIETVGGKNILETRLDSLFTASSHVDGETASADITGLIGQYAHGNEPSHHIAYLYNWTDNPSKGQEKLDFVMKNFYTPAEDGIIGNEDCGQMSAWYVMSALGFYQVCPGEPVYTVGRPIVDDAKIQLQNGKTFEILVLNNSADNKYVQQVELNGKVLDDLFFTHDDIMNGGKLTITMGATPKN